jgi:hypothetical protein
MIDRQHNPYNQSTQLPTEQTLNSCTDLRLMVTEPGGPCSVATGVNHTLPVQVDESALAGEALLQAPGKCLTQPIKLGQPPAQRHQSATWLVKQGSERLDSFYSAMFCATDHQSVTLKKSR